MKKLGRSFTNEEWDHIVGVTRYELDLIEKFLETHDITAEEQYYQQWREDFRQKLSALTLDGYTRNCLSYSLGYDSLFRDDDDQFLSFEAWAQIVLEGYRRHGPRGPNFPRLSSVRNFGIASYLKLIAALQQWERGQHDD